MSVRHAPILTHVKTNQNIEGIVALLQQLVAQNEELARELAAVKAKLELIENKIDTIAEEAGMI
jgi:prefoldin subunit 5